jgi:hypothetical protein
LFLRAKLRRVSTIKMMATARPAAIRYQKTAGADERAWGKAGSAAVAGSVGDGVRVGRAVGDRVTVAAGVGRAVAVCVGVRTGAGDGVAVSTGVGTFVGVGVALYVGDGSGVSAGVGITAVGEGSATVGDRGAAARLTASIASPVT